MMDPTMDQTCKRYQINAFQIESLEDFICKAMLKIALNLSLELIQST